MDLALSGSTLLGAIIGVIVLILAIIFVLRSVFGGKTPEQLAQLHEGNDSPLLKRGKYPEADSFRWSNTFLLGGLAVSILLTLLAFSWTSYEEVVYIPEGAMEMEDDIMIEPPRTAEPPPPPPPPPPPVIEEVPDEEILEEEVEFVDNTVEEETVVEAPEPEPVKAPPPPPPPPPPKEKIQDIFKVVEDMPRFFSNECESKGSKDEIKQCAQAEMLKFIYKNIKYPPIARENGIEGTVVIRFVVDEKGTVKDPEILRDIGAGCGAEAQRVVNMMPKWKPGEQGGRKVPVYFNLPVKFKLE